MCLTLTFRAFPEAWHSISEAPSPTTWSIAWGTEPRRPRPSTKKHLKRASSRSKCERGIRLINLSLGTPNEFRVPELAPAVERAVVRGAIIVSAFEFEDRLWFPGAMPGVVGVVVDARQPRDDVAVVDRPAGSVLSASPYPRPIPGVPPERNLNGMSFAVANATGVLARALAGRVGVRSAEAAIDELR
jgi:hypothetical protein